MAISEVRRSFDSAVKNLGYKKTGSSWSILRGEVREVLGLQKSNYSGEHYVNFGLSLMREHMPRESPIDSDVYLRFEMIFGERWSACKAWFNDEEDNAAEERARVMRETISYLDGFLSSAVDRESFVSLVRNPRFDGLGVELRCARKNPEWSSIVSAID